MHSNEAQPDVGAPATGPARANSAAELFPLVYEELRYLSRAWMAAERPNHTLDPTAVVHEAYLRLIRHRRVEWKGRVHFFAVAAGMIRRILVDHARAHAALKRGGALRAVHLQDVESNESGADAGQAGGAAGSIAGGPDLLDLDEALEELGALNERQVRVVELRFFGGLSLEEAAEVLEVSPQTVKRDWSLARAWLQARLSR